MRIVSSLLLFCLAWTTKAASLVEMLGLGSLLQGLAIRSPSQDPFGNPSTAYMLDPNISTFLLQFNSRTEFCDYKCASMFNLPCFILFGCNIQIRNFILIFMLPFFILTLSGICCGKGIWTFGCWMRYLAIFTGISIIIWAVRKCAEGGSVRKRKEEVKAKQMQIAKSKQNQYQIQPCETAERMNNRKSATSSQQSQD